MTAMLTATATVDAEIAHPAINAERFAQTELYEAYAWRCAGSWFRLQFSPETDRQYFETLIERFEKFTLPSKETGFKSDVCPLTVLSVNPDRLALILNPNPGVLPTDMPRRDELCREVLRLIRQCLGGIVNLKEGLAPYDPDSNEDD